MTKHISINGVVAEAFAIALERMTQAGVHHNDIRMDLGVGDGGGVILYHKDDKFLNVEVTFGGGMNDEEGEIYNRVMSVNYNIEWHV